MTLVRRLSFVLLCACATARADIPNPDIRDVDPEMAFSGVADHPDHVFLIHVMDKTYWGPNVPFESRVIPIPGPKPFTPGFRQTIGKVAILAVPKAAYEKLAEPERKALTPESPGVLSCAIAAPRMTVGVRDPDPGTIRYRVAIADGTLRVEPAAPGDRDSSAAAPGRRRGAWWGVALAASVAWLGLVVGRRLVRRES